VAGEQPKPDCLTCGACCCAGLDVPLWPGERDDFEKRPHLVQLTQLRRVGPRLMRFLRHTPETGRCIALRGALGDVYCGIYNDRPMLCREFEPGCPECYEYRRQFGIDPPLDEPAQAAEA
jgi:Fe-S-cluster containining protein